MAKRKKNYLNNKDMMNEIHISKMTFCSFRDKIEDNQQDFIVEDINDIFGLMSVQVGKDDEGKAIMEDKPVLELAFAARASRLSKLEIPTEISDIKLEDIVFRVLTTEHIPLVPKKKSKATLARETLEAKSLALFEELLEDDEIPAAEIDPNIEMVPMRCNFPSFVHYRFLPGSEGSENKDQLILVGKSHWKGPLEDGVFCKSHGQSTDNLARMYLKLCERYGSRSNWRSYTYNDEMQGQALLQLTQVGLQFNEYRSQNPFSYFTQIVSNSFTRIFNIEKKMQEIRDDILEMNQLTPSWSRQMENDKQAVVLPEDFYKSQKNAIYKKKPDLDQKIK